MSKYRDMFQGKIVITQQSILHIENDLHALYELDEFTREEWDEIDKALTAANARLNQVRHLLDKKS